MWKGRIWNPPLQSQTPKGAAWFLTTIITDIQVKERSLKPLKAGLSFGLRLQSEEFLQNLRLKPLKAGLSFGQKLNIKIDVEIKGLKPLKAGLSFGLVDENMDRT